MNDSSLINSCARRWQSHTLCAIILNAPVQSATYDVGIVHCGDSSITIAWHKLRLHRRKPVNTLCSGDGGLVCFCLTFEKAAGGLQLILSVVNPLTGACRVLPSDHGVSPLDLRMMQLVIDKSTRQYRVLLVHDKKEPSSFSTASQSSHEMSEEASVMEESAVELIGFDKYYPEPLGGVIFDSSTGEWRNARSSSQVFLGPAIHEKRYVTGSERGWKGVVRYSDGVNYRMNCQGSFRFFGPVAYDCSTGKVITLLDIWANALIPHPEFALSKGCLFELSKIHGSRLLNEYQIRVKEDHLGLALVHYDCLSLEARAKMNGMWPIFPLRVLACEGYVLVRGSHYEEIFHHSSYRVVGLLYNMRAGEWVDLLEGRLDQALDEDERVEMEEDSDKMEPDLPQSVTLERGRQVSVFGSDHPYYFESAPGTMLCNLDWEALP